MKQEMFSFMQVADFLVPEAKKDSEKEFVVYRIKPGCWKCDCLRKGQSASVPEEVQSIDPLAVTFTAKNLAYSKFAVHEFLLTARLHREVRLKTCEDLKELEAITHFMDYCVDQLPLDAIEHLANHEDVIDILSRTIPVSLRSDEYAFNAYNAPAALKALLANLV